MNVHGIDHEAQDRSIALVHRKQRAQTHKHNLARLPWWREPPVGYIMTFPLVGEGLLIPFGLQSLGIENAFLDTPFVLVTLIIALIWGTEPAVLSILLGTLAFDIFFFFQLVHLCIICTNCFSSFHSCLLIASSSCSLLNVSEAGDKYCLHGKS